MCRRGERPPGLKVRVSYEATRLSEAHLAAAFERLVPALERRPRPPRPQDDPHAAEPTRAGVKPMKGR